MWESGQGEGPERGVGGKELVVGQWGPLAGAGGTGRGDELSLHPQVP